MSRRKRVDEGAIFLIPLRDLGYAVGVLARTSGEGHALGYFFGPRVFDVSDVTANSLEASNAILISKFGDIELVRGDWPIIDFIDPWDPSKWPMMPLARIDECVGKAWLSTYDDKFYCVGENEISIEESRNYPYDRLMGPGSVEIRMTKLLESTNPIGEGDETAS